jgi:hypothetical protein
MLGFALGQIVRYKTRLKLICNVGACKCVDQLMGPNFIHGHSRCGHCLPPERLNEMDILAMHFTHRSADMTKATEAGADSA